MVKPEDLVVELVPHMGRQSTRIGVLEVDLGQWRVKVNGFCVGYIDKQPGFGVKLTYQNLPEAAKQIIKDKVDVLLGRVNPPIATSSIIEEDEDDEPED